MRLFAPSRRLRWVVVLALLVTAGAVWGASKLGYDFSPQALYASQDNDNVAFHEGFGDAFGHEDALILIVLEATEGQSVLSPAALTWLRRTAFSVGATDDVAGVYSIATLDAFWSGVPAADTVVSESDAEAFTQQLAGTALIDGLLVNKARRRATTIAGMAPTVRSVERMRPALARVKAAVAHNPLPVGFSLRLSGLPVVREHVVTDLKAEQRTKLPIAALMFVLVMWFALGSLTAALLPMAGVGLGLLWTTGALGAMGVRLNIIDNMMPIVLLVIGAANGIHIVHRYAEEVARTPNDRRAAYRRAMRRMATACFFTYATTAVGFVSLTMARFDALRAVGWHMALGLMVLYASSMLVMALCLHRIRPRTHGISGGENTRGWSISGFLARIGDAVTAHPRAVALSALVLLGLGLFGATRLPLRTSILETYEPSHPVRQTMRVVEEELGGVLTIDISLLAVEKQALAQPAVQAKITDLTSWAQGRGPVAMARSYVDLQSAVLKRIEGDVPVADRTPEQVAQADMLARTLNSTLRYNRFMTDDGLHGRIMLRVRDEGSDVLLAFEETLRAKLAQLDLESNGVSPRITGLGHVYANALTGFIEDMLRSLGGAALVVFVLIGLLFRSIRIALISILPNITPLVLTLGYMSLRGYDLNRASVIVFAIGLGVAVDDTIHFLVRYREESMAGIGVRDAVRRTLFGAGRAMVVTTLLMVIGLAFVHTSDFLPTRRFAELTSVMMGAALIGDLCLLPALLVLFRRKGRPA